MSKAIQVPHSVAVVGLQQEPVEYARECALLWKHLGEDECAEQVEAHMESERYSDAEISVAMGLLGYFHHACPDLNAAAIAKHGALS